MSQKQIVSNVFGGAMVAVAGMAAIAAAAPAPLLSYNFNEGSGTTATNGGTARGASGDGTVLPGNADLGSGTGVTPADFHGANGSGVSGQAGDYGLNFSAPASQGTGSSLARVTRPTIQNLSSFTVSGWMKADEIIGGSARLFYFTSDNATNGFNVSAATNGTLGLNVNNFTSGTDSGAIYGDVGTYQFFAITYDGTSTVNNVTFYKGTPAGGALTTVTRTVNQGTVATVAGSPYFFYFGNTGNANRQFDGFLDNIALYGSSTGNTGALSAADVQAVYASAVPEPASVAVLGLGGIAALARRRRPACR